MIWEKGRQLKCIQNGQNQFLYTYNANGIRTSKTVNGVKHSFILDGAKILGEYWDGNTLIPLYDNEDNVCGILHNDIPYYFLKNLQGDVIAITNQRGETVARYTYDAWGSCTITYDATATPTVEGGEAINIATVNPFRYRSYYFDTETGLYYLQSRYYDPALGRFINGDDPQMIDSASDYNLLGTNKYCYCLNSPINNSDEFGCVAAAIVKMIGNFFFGMLGGMLGMYLANVTLNVVRKKKNIFAKNDTWGAYVAEGIKSGAFSIFGSKLLYKIIAAIGAAVVKQIIDVFFSKKNFSLWNLLFDVLVGIFFVILIHFGGTVLKKLPKGKRSNKWLDNLKSIVKKIANYVIDKATRIIQNLCTFFKTFVTRFSISYAKKCGSELLKAITG